MTLGIVIFIAGACLGIVSHYILLYSGFRGSLKRRLALGVPGWIIAGALVWRGVSMMLN